MKKLIWIGILLGLVLTLLLGCSEEPDPDRESHSDRIDRLYAECIEAGGSWEYNGSLPYWQCEQ